MDVVCEGRWAFSSFLRVSGRDCVMCRVGGKHFLCTLSGRLRLFQVLKKCFKLLKNNDYQPQ